MWQLALVLNVNCLTNKKSDLTYENFLSALGKFVVDDPAGLDILILASLREKLQARNSLASLHAARSRLLLCKNWEIGNGTQTNPGWSPT